jgi:hypothetical protein
MASMFENEYKLLARSGNKVQEVNVSEFCLVGLLPTELDHSSSHHFPP